MPHLPPRHTCHHATPATTPHLPPRHTCHHATPATMPPNHADHPQHNLNTRSTPTAWLRAEPPTPCSHHPFPPIALLSFISLPLPFSPPPLPPSLLPPLLPPPCPAPPSLPQLTVAWASASTMRPRPLSLVASCTHTSLRVSTGWSSSGTRRCVQGRGGRGGSVGVTGPATLTGSTDCLNWAQVLLTGLPHLLAWFTDHHLKSLRLPAHPFWRMWSWLINLPLPPASPQPSAGERDPC